MGQGNTQRYCTHLTQDSCVLHTSHSRLLCTAHISLKTLVYCTHLTQDSCVRTHLTQDSCVLHTSHSRLLCTNTSHSRLLCTAHISLKTLVYCTHLTQDSCVLHTSHSRLLCTNTYLKGSMEERCMYLFVAIFQVAWNPLKLGMPALLMWKTVPALFSPSGERRLQTRSWKSTPPPPPLYPPSLYPPSPPSDCGNGVKTHTHSVSILKDQNPIMLWRQMRENLLHPAVWAKCGFFCCCSPELQQALAWTTLVAAPMLYSRSTSRRYVEPTNLLGFIEQVESYQQFQPAKTIPADCSLVLDPHCVGSQYIRERVPSHRFGTQ